MASTNQSPFYKQAEARFLSARNNEEKIDALEEMIKECPKHKSSEKMLANLKTRLKKLFEKQERGGKAGKSRKSRIKKEEMRAVIIGKTNTGKSSLIALLTNARPKISEERFTTTGPVVGMMNYEGANIQLIEIPAIESGYYDKGLVNTADIFLILITDLEQLKEIEEKLKKASGKRIIVFNQTDLLSEEEKRKISATLQSRKYNHVMLSIESALQGWGNEEDLDELKEKLFISFDKIRVYTKEPEKEKSNRPIILGQNATVQEVAEKILKGFSKNVKETKIWGPSSKFPGQKVGLQHNLKDLDVIQFKTK